MKVARIGVVLTAILMVVAGVGFGIAQASETSTTGEVMAWQSLDKGSSSSPYVAENPEDQVIPQVALLAEDGSIAENPEDQEVPQVAQWPGHDALMEDPIETGGLPSTSVGDASVVETEGN
jgi:hypothetical protein